MNHINNISAEIVNILTDSGGSILGSQLGAKIKTRLKDILGCNTETEAIEQFKAEYGGIARFISIHCGGNVTVSGKQGMDNIYILTTGNNGVDDAATFLRSNFKANEVIQNRIWKLFCNPNSNSNISVSISNEIVVEATPLHHSKVDNDRYLIHPTTKDEHRGMIEEFLNKNVRSDDIRFSDRTIFAGEDYWGRWQDLIREDKILSERWSSFRKEKIFRILIDRIVNLGLNNQRSASVLLCFMGRSENSEERDSVQNKKNDEKLRARLITIVTKMEPEDLREIKIPVKYFEEF